MSKKSITTVIYILIFGISFATVESSVVVYLRELFYPEGFNFPLKLMHGNVMKVEMWRELATMFLLVSAALLSGRNNIEKFAYFIFAFAIWDIFYYVFLYLFIGWPENLLVWDILFLLPTTWVGPVIAPVINSFCMIAIGLLIIKITDTNKKCFVKWKSWSLLILGSFFVLYSYMEEYLSFMLQHFSISEILSSSNTEQLLQSATSYEPQRFLWIPFVIGVIMHLAALFSIQYENKKVA